MSTRGRFITLEGGEGAGKSTHAAGLAGWLRARGHDVIETREPGGTTGGEAIRDLLLGGAGDRWSAEAEALLFAAARAEHVGRLIRPALEAGKWVICDRFLDSSLAYQGAAGGLGVEAVRRANLLALDGLLPDLTLLLQVPPREGQARTPKRDRDRSDRIAARDTDYHSQVAGAFDALASAEPERIVRVDASGDVATVTARIEAAVTRRLPCA